MRDTPPPLSEERIAAYVRGELSSAEHAQVEAALDEDPQWLTVVALLARQDAAAVAAPRSDEGSTRGGSVHAAPTTGADTIGRLEREHTARLRPGDRLGRYEVVGPLGRGGMGMIYAAHDPKLDRRVALKLLRGTEPRDQPRLLREARALARLSDRHVITIHDVGTWRGRVFLTMELLDGQTLGAWRAAQPRSWREVVAKYVDAGRGLQAAHAAGLVHRDFKPSNVMLTADGRVVVLDFGLAHAIDRPISRADDPQPERSRAEAINEHGLTRTGQLVGTPAYMAPEQRRGEICGPATDQFSFCVALFESLHGHLPAAAHERERALHGAATGRIPRRVERLLSRGLAASADDRHRSMGQLVDALHAIVHPTRQRLALAVLAGLGGAGAGAAWAISDGDPPATAPLCTGSTRALSSTWNESRAQAVSSALAAPQLPWSERVRDEVDTRLRRYADAWLIEHEAACRAARIDGVDTEAILELRMVCLDRRRRSLAALVDVLAGADVEVAMQAVQATQALPSLAVCRDVEALRAPVPLPDEPERRAQAEAIFDQLAQVEALRRAKHLDEAARLAERSVQRAEALEHLPTEADARLAWGWVLTDQGDHDAAEAQLRAALHAAEAGRHDPGVALAWNRLAWVVGYKDARFDEGRQLAQHAQAWTGRTTEPAYHELSRRRSLGWIEHEAGNYAVALEQFEAAVREAEGLPDDDVHRSAELAMVLNGLGAAAISAADLPRASDAFSRSIALMEASLGADHPDVALVRNNLGTLMRAQGQVERAHGLLEHNLAVFEATHGDAHPLVGQTLINLAVVELDLGRHDDAHAHADRSITVMRAAHGPTHPMVAKGHTIRGDARVQLGRPADAIDDFERALPLEIETLGPEHPSVGIIESNLGNAYYTLERFDDAATHHQRALAILEAALGPEHPNLAVVLTGLGLIRRQQERPDEALALFRRAAAIGDALSRPEAMTQIGKIQLDRGQVDASIAILEDALAQYGQTEHAPGFSGDTHRALARALWADGQTARAHAEATAAIEDYRAAGDTEALTQTEAWVDEHPVRHSQD